MAIFKIDGKEYQFCFDEFNNQFNVYKNTNGKMVKEVEEKIAEKANVSQSAVHQWKYEKNGPSEIEMIKAIADLFGIKNYKIFLRERSNIVKNWTEKQENSVKRVYDAVIDFLFEFEQTMGFNDLYVDIKNKYNSEGINISDKNIVDEIYRYADRKLNEVHNVLRKEYFYLCGFSIYEELSAYMYNDLSDIYWGKCSYAYRFEEEGDTVGEDRAEAVKKLNRIVGIPE